MRNRLLVSVLLLVFLPAMLVLAGGGSETPQAASAAPARTVLKVGVDNFPAQWDPATRFSNNSMKMHGNMFDGLVRIDAYSKDYAPKPMLAVSWKQISPTVTEFKLRQGVKFWDGSPVTAEDVAWSLNRSIRGEYPRYVTYAYGRVLYNFKEVEIVDAETVRIHTVKPEPLLFAMLSQSAAGIVSRKAFEAAGSDYAAYTRSPVGCGPYKIKEFRDDEYIKLERFDGYWGGPAPLEKLEYYLIADISARITALVNGEVDMVTCVPPDQIGALEGKPGIRVVGNNPLLFHVYVLNTNRYPLNDQRVRMAMNLAIDRQALNNALWAGKGFVPTSFQLPTSPGYDPNWKVFEYNPEKARQLLQEAKYDGTPLEFDVIKAYYTYGDQAAEAIAKMWEKVGFKVQLKFIEDYRPRDVKHPENWHMIYAWSNTMSVPFEPIGTIPDWYPSSWPITDGIIADWAPKDHPAFPAGGKYRDKYISLYEKARYGTNKAESFQAFKDFINHVHYEATPWVMLYAPYEYYAMDADIQWEVPPNYHPYTMPFRAGEISFK